MTLNLLRDCKDIKGEEEKKEGCVKHRERSSVCRRHKDAKRDVLHVISISL